MMMVGGSVEGHAAVCGLRHRVAGRFDSIPASLNRSRYQVRPTNLITVTEPWYLPIKVGDYYK